MCGMDLRARLYYVTWNMQLVFHCAKCRQPCDVVLLADCLVPCGASCGLLGALRCCLWVAWSLVVLLADELVPCSGVCGLLVALLWPLWIGWCLQID